MPWCVRRCGAETGPVTDAFCHRVKIAVIIRIRREIAATSAAKIEQRLAEHRCVQIKRRLICTSCHVCALQCHEMQRARSIMAVSRPKHAGAKRGIMKPGGGEISSARRPQLGDLSRDRGCGISLPRMAMTLGQRRRRGQCCRHRLAGLCYVGAHAGASRRKASAQSSILPKSCKGSPYKETAAPPISGDGAGRELRIIARRARPAGSTRRPHLTSDSNGGEMAYRRAYSACGGMAK